MSGFFFTFILQVGISYSLASASVGGVLCHVNNLYKIDGPDSLSVRNNFDTSNLTYSRDTVKLKRSEYFTRFSNLQKEIILSVNRISESSVRLNKILLIPNSAQTNLLYYSPFPDVIKTNSDSSKFVVICQRIQAFGIYENDSLIRWGPVSTGKKSTPTPNGLFFANWKIEWKRSTIDYDWIMPWYVNIENHRGIAMHEYNLPGYPASHACIRLLNKDATWIYEWVDVRTYEKATRNVIKGTPIILTGDYEYGTKPPWFYLSDDPKHTDLNSDELSMIDSLLNKVYEK